MFFTEKTKAEYIASSIASDEIGYATDTFEIVYTSSHTGAMTFTKDGNNIPMGGAVGQALKKSGVLDLVVAWVTLREVTENGTLGQYLKNLGDNTYGWADLPVYREVTSAGTTGQYLKNLGSDTYTWSDLPAAVEVPINGIIMFNDVIGNAPVGFVACDGTNGTPDLSAEVVLHIMRLT